MLSAPAIQYRHITQSPGPTNYTSTLKKTNIDYYMIKKKKVIYFFLVVIYNYK